MPQPIDFSFNSDLATLYNQQRAHPPSVSEAVGAAIAQWVGVGNRVLEVGVGTGRIAHPVVQAGCHVVGIDLSDNMLEQVYGDPTISRGAPGLMLAQADMHKLPFADNSFDALLVVHVLHLSNDTPTLLHEMARVLKPGGLLIKGDDWMDPTGVVGMLRNELRNYVIQHIPEFIPPSAMVSREQMLADLGGTEVHEDQIVAEWEVEISPAQRLQMIENRMDAESWILTEDTFEQALAHLRAYAADQWDDLNVVQASKKRFILRVTTGDWVTRSK